MSWCWLLLACCVEGPVNFWSWFRCEAGRRKQFQIRCCERHKHSDNLFCQQGIHFQLRSPKVVQATIGELHLDSKVVSKIDEFFADITVIINIFQIQPERGPDPTVTRSQLSHERRPSKKVGLQSNCRCSIFFQQSGCKLALSLSVKLLTPFPCTGFKSQCNYDRARWIAQRSGLFLQEGEPLFLMPWVWYYCTSLTAIYGYIYAWLLINLEAVIPIWPQFCQQFSLIFSQSIHLRCSDGSDW